MSMVRRTRIVIIASSVLLLGICLFALMYGSYSMSVQDVLNTLIFGGNKSERLAIWGIRLPRTLVAIFVGTALSASGSIMQGVTHNPLAEPGIIGINAGATFAVVTFISLSSEAYYSALGTGTLLLTPLVSIFGAFTAALVIFLLSRRDGKAAPNRLVLVGVGVGIAISAVTTLMQLSMSKGNYNQALTWTNGSLWGTGFLYLVMIAPLTITIFAVLIYKCKTLDVIGLGDDIAVGLGVNVEKERKVFLALAVLLAAGATAVAGNITFVGLVGPHIAQRLVGPSHKRKLPVAAVISACLVVLADTLARNLFSPLEIPVGIVISLIGVPYFIYLMLKEK